VSPAALPTEGGYLTINGENLGGTRCRVTAAAGRLLVPVVMETVEETNTLLKLRIGPGVGSGYQLVLSNRTGSTFTPFRFQGGESTPWNRVSSVVYRSLTDTPSFSDVVLCAICER
jgi:hypothetical protein